MNATTVLAGSLESPLTVTVEAADDGLHADGAMIVDGAALTVTGSYEGLEAAQLTIAGGTLEDVSISE